MTRRTNSVVIAPTLLGIALVLAQSTVGQAAVIGYWRFEGDATTGFVADSSTPAYNLTKVGNPTQYTLPASGKGSAFHDPIPQNNLANDKAADLDGNDYFRHADETAFAVSDFTIEAYIHSTTAAQNGTYRMIASQWGPAVAGNKAWWFGLVDNGSNPDRLAVALSDGTSMPMITSPFTISTDRDYYVAASFDESESGSGKKGLTFYCWDLSTPGTLQAESVDHNISNLHNPNFELNIGTVNASSATNTTFIGLIDEVRWSNAVLSPGELFAVIPTAPKIPASAWLFNQHNAGDSIDSVHGTLVGNPTFVGDTPLSHPFNSSIDLDGNDYVKFGSGDYNFAVDDPFSVSLWVKGDADGFLLGKEWRGTGGYVAADDFRGWEIRRVLDGKVVLQLREDWNMSGPTGSSFINVMTDDAVLGDGGAEWHHLLATYDGSGTADGLNLYHDGVLLMNVTRDTGGLWQGLSSVVTSNATLAIGNRNGDNNTPSPLDGLLDEVLIWDGTTLTGEQALWLYNNSLMALIPEPSTALLAALGLVGMLACSLRRRRKR